MSELGAFAEAAVRIATPLAFAALGETVTQRSGVINIGLEGAMLCGALAGAAAGMAIGSPWAGLAGGIAAGAVAGWLFALLTVRLGCDQIVTGTAFTLGAIGLTGALYRAAFGTTGTALSVPTFGPVVLGQPAPLVLLVFLLPPLWFVLQRTQPGLSLRAAGEAPQAAEAAGISVVRVRTAATVFGAAMGGLAGATLVLAQAGTFAERMTAGRGFIAIAIVVLGRWHPLGVAAGALLFGAASAFQYAFQAAGIDLPYQLVLMAPYAATLLALAGIAGRARAPEALGRPWQG